MIAKKNPRLNLEGKRIVLFQIGLFTSSAFALAAFTYKSPVNETIKTGRESVVNLRYELQETKETPKKIEIPVVREIPRNTDNQVTVDAQQTIGDQITATDNTSKGVEATGDGNTGDLNVGDFDNFGGGIQDIDIEIVEIPAVDAEYIGGYIAMSQFIVDHLNYPQDAIELNMQGKVFISFVVEKDGSVSNVHVERGVYQSIDREAERIVRMFPTWKPGEMPTGKVRTRVRIPINFTLK